MPYLLLKDVPRYDCLIEAAQRFPDLDPSATAVFLNMLRTSDELMRGVEAHLASHNISQGRFTVLMLLMHQGQGCGLSKGAVATPATLAEMAGVTRATMTGLVDTLERDGFVRREPDLHDRRMQTVSLTAKGQQFMEALLPGHFRLMADAVSALDEQERATLTSLLNKILQRPPSSLSVAQTSGSHTETLG